MKKFLSLFGIVAVCFFIGYGIGNLFTDTMQPNKKEKGYIGKSEIKIGDGVMTPEVLLSLGRLSDPQISPDGKKVLYGVSYTDIKGNRSCRNLFVSNIDGTDKVQLTRYAKSVNCARWTPDGKFIVFVQGGQIWKAAFGGKKLGARKQISDVPAGISEFSISPDGNNIIYVSTIPGPVTSPKDADPELDKARAYVATDLMYRHWDHWVTETPRSYVAPFAGDMITPENSFDILGSAPAGIELPTEPFGGVEQLAWAPDSRHIAYSCRKLKGKEYAFSTNTSIYVYDVVTGQDICVTGKGGYDTNPVWSEDGRRLAWISMARDGYEADQQRLMVADVLGVCGCCASCAEEDGQSNGIFFKNVRCLSKDFDHDVEDPVWKGDEIWFHSLMPEAVSSIFKADLEGNVQRITPGDWNFDFFSPWGWAEDGTILASNYCINRPVELVSIKADGSQCDAISCENEHIISQLEEIGQESVHVKTVDGKDMQCWVLYPPHFDALKTYPAIEIVLGGPQGTNSQDWSYRWCYRLMAQQGYVVILPNRRGTTAFGQAWKEQISGDYPGLNMQDYLSAGRYIKSKPYVGKLACVGASYGGYSAYMLEGLHGDLYDCFIAHAGIFDEKDLWFTTEEMWFANWDNGGLTEYDYREGEQGPAGDGIHFGGMQQAGAPYAKTPKAQRHYANAPSTMITKWHTPILCIHGMMDFRIPYTQGMAAFNAAQMMGVPSKLLIFPEENHWILQPQNSLFWHKEFYNWLEEWCK